MTTTDRATWPLPERRFDGFTRSSRYITMRDGCRLAADIYLPAPMDASERLGAILVMTPYLRGLELRSPELEEQFPALAYDAGGFGAGFARFGYAVLVIETRGSAASFGTRTNSPPDDLADDIDIVEWVIAQPWSNGRVGATGISAPGLAALSLAARNHPAVRAVAPLWTAFDFYAATHPGGAVMSVFAQAITDATRLLDQGRIDALFADLPDEQRELMSQIVVGLRPVDDDHDRSLLAAAIAEHEGSVYIGHASNLATFRDEQIVEADAGTTLEAVGPAGRLDELRAADVAIFAYGGWNDASFTSELVNLHMSVPGPRNRLLMGPWGHGGNTYASPVTDGVRPTDFDHHAELAAFWDVHLREDGAPDDAPRVRYFTMGAEAWREAATWPPPATGTDLYLAADNMLVFDPPSSDGADRYVVDHSVGSGTTSRYSRSSTPVHYGDRAPADRALLTYTTAPLADAIEVTGWPMIELHVSSSEPDALFIVYLEDVCPDGRVRMVTEGVLRGRFHAIADRPPLYDTGPAPFREHRAEDDSPLPVGEPVKLVFATYPVSYRFDGGHRVRIALSGADSDNLSVPPDAVAPEITVLRAPQHPSRITLPVV